MPGKRKGTKRAAGSGSGGGQHRGEQASPRSWFARNRRDVRFLLLFALWMGGYYLLTLTNPVRNGFFPAYLRLNARLSALMLHAVGESVTVSGDTLASTGGVSVSIRRGCDAVEPSALFIAAVMASPVAFRWKWPAVVMGTLLLLLLNLIRIATLFWVRVHYPDWFETMHLDVWQVLFIFAAVLLWATWAARAARHAADRAGAPA